MNENQVRILGLIRDVPDWPKPGVTFKDITPMLERPDGLRAAVAELAATAPSEIDIVVGMEARGFIFASPVALELGAGFVPVRKPGKLPGDVYSQSCSLEYGHETLTMPVDALWPAARGRVIDAALLQRLGARLVHVSVLMELGFLDGRRALAEAGIESYSSVVTV